VLKREAEKANHSRGPERNGGWKVATIGDGKKYGRVWISRGGKQSKKGGLDHEKESSRKRGIKKVRRWRFDKLRRQRGISDFPRPIENGFTNRKKKTVRAGGWGRGGEKRTSPRGGRNMGGE